MRLTLNLAVGETKVESSVAPCYYVAIPGNRWACDVAQAHGSSQLDVWLTQAGHAYSLSVQRQGENAETIPCQSPTRIVVEPWIIQRRGESSTSVTVELGDLGVKSELGTHTMAVADSGQSVSEPSIISVKCATKNQR